jgi:hypothetical protein
MNKEDNTIPSSLKEEILKKHIDAYNKIVSHVYQFKLNTAEKTVFTEAMEEYAQQLQSPGTSDAVELIAKERQRQIEIEKWDYSHDADYGNGELIGAAACYAVNALNKDREKPFARAQVYDEPETDFMVNNGDRGDRRLNKGGWRDAWPWDAEYDKRKKHDKMRSLVIAGALIAAEIDRLLQSKQKGDNYDPS